MTKSEFERYKRFLYEKGETSLSGYAHVFFDCPDLSKEIKEIKHSDSFPFYFEEISIIGNKFRILNLTKNKESVSQEFNFRYVKNMEIYLMRNWEDKGGKRDSKLNWYLKNIQNVS
jgi:hypothetical protein